MQLHLFLIRGLVWEEAPAEYASIVIGSITGLEER